MSIPSSAKFEIVTYRDFHDIPRLILAKEAEESFWILDGGFNDEMDEYELNFVVYHCQSNVAEAQRIFEALADRSIYLQPEGLLPVSSVSFDETRRQILGWNIQA